MQHRDPSGRDVLQIKAGERNGRQLHITRQPGLQLFLYFGSPQMGDFFRPSPVPAFARASNDAHSRQNDDKGERIHIEAHRRLPKPALSDGACIGLNRVAPFKKLHARHPQFGHRLRGHQQASPWHPSRMAARHAPTVALPAPRHEAYRTRLVQPCTSLPDSRPHVPRSQAWHSYCIGKLGGQ